MSEPGKDREVHETPPYRVGRVVTEDEIRGFWAWWAGQDAERERRIREAVGEIGEVFRLAHPELEP